MSQENILIFKGAIEVLETRFLTGLAEQNNEESKRYTEKERKQILEFLSGIRDAQSKAVRDESISLRDRFRLVPEIPHDELQQRLEAQQPELCEYFGMPVKTGTLSVPGQGTRPVIFMECHNPPVASCAQFVFRQALLYSAIASVNTDGTLKIWPSWGSPSQDVAFSLFDQSVIDPEENFRNNDIPDSERENITKLVLFTEQWPADWQANFKDNYDFSFSRNFSRNISWLQFLRAHFRQVGLTAVSRYQKIRELYEASDNLLKASQCFGAAGTLNDAIDKTRQAFTEIAVPTLESAAQEISMLLGVPVESGIWDVTNLRDGKYSGLCLIDLGNSNLTEEDRIAAAKQLEELISGMCIGELSAFLAKKGPEGLTCRDYDSKDPEETRWLVLDIKSWPEHWKDNLMSYRPLITDVPLAAIQKTLKEMGLETGVPKNPMQHPGGPEPVN